MFAVADRFRREVYPIGEKGPVLINEMKKSAEKLEIEMMRFLEEGIQNQNANRCLSVALTNLEQAVMWATKAIVTAGV